MKLKRSQVIEIFDALGSFKETYNKYFVYHLTKTMNALSPERNALIEMARPSDNFLEYERRRTRMVDVFAERDKDGNMIMQNGMVKIREDKLEECKNGMDELNEEYSETLKLRQEEVQHIERILDEEVEISIELIPFHTIPEQINKETLEKIMPVVVYN